MAAVSTSPMEAVEQDEDAQLVLGMVDDPEAAFRRMLCHYIVLHEIPGGATRPLFGANVEFTIDEIAADHLARVVESVITHDRG